MSVLLVVLIPLLGYCLFRKFLDRVFDLPVTQEVRHIGDKSHVEVSKND